MHHLSLIEMNNIALAVLSYEMSLFVHSAIDLPPCRVWIIGACSKAGKLVCRLLWSHAVGYSSSGLVAEAEPSLPLASSRSLRSLPAMALLLN